MLVTCRSHAGHMLVTCWSHALTFGTAAWNRKSDIVWAVELLAVRVMVHWLGSEGTLLKEKTTRSPLPSKAVIGGIASGEWEENCRQIHTHIDAHTCAHTHTHTHTHTHARMHAHTHARTRLAVPVSTD